LDLTQYEQYLKLFSSIDIKNDLKINFIDKENINNPDNVSKYQCNILIYLIRNFGTIEVNFNSNYFPKENKNTDNFNNNRLFPRKHGALSIRATNVLTASTMQYNPAPNFTFANNPYPVSLSSDGIDGKFLESSFMHKKPAVKRGFINIFENNQDNNSSMNEDEGDNDNKSQDFINDKEIKKEKEMNLSIYTGSPIAKFFLNFISLGCDINQKDSNGRDILFYCIIENNFELIKFLFLNLETHIKLDSIDKDKKGLIHYVINPFYESNNNNNIGNNHTNNANASFENTLLLKYLISKGIKYDLFDIYGKSPIDYALERKSKVLINCFEELNLITKNEIENKRKAILNKEKYLLNKFERNNINEIDYHKDAEILIKENIQNGKNIIKREIIPDPIGRFDNKKNKVIKELQIKKVINNEINTDDINMNIQKEEYYDITLTKVNIGNGLYGQYMFYKMQIIHDIDRNVYILWNRWGRIPEEGAYQRTPFISLIDAKNEFKKIFKSKTGNEWENKHSKIIIKNFNKI
jgi:hypothetical protein